MKIAISLLLTVALLALCLTGCGEPAEETNGNGTTTTTTTTTTADGTGTESSADDTTTTAEAVTTTAGAPTPSTPPASVAGPKIGLEYEYLALPVVSGGDLSYKMISFDDETYVILGDRMFSTEVNDSIAISYQGVTYYSVGAGFAPFTYTITNHEVVICQMDTTNVVLRLTVQANGTLKITSSTRADYPVGTVFELEPWN